MTTESLSASLEDYLEAILGIIAVKQAARAKDISDRLQVSKSSVTGALKTLAERGLVNYAPYDLVTLTSQGKVIAEDVTRRHEVLSDFFVRVLAVDPVIANEGACKMEHAIPPLIMDRFVQFLEYMELCPRGGDRWTRDFGYFCNHGKTNASCDRCLRSTLELIQSQKKQSSSTFSLLTQCLDGQKGRIKKIREQEKIRPQLLRAGLVPGALIQLEKSDPLQGIWQVKIRGYHLNLHYEEAKRVEIQPQSSPDKTKN